MPRGTPNRAETLGISRLPPRGGNGWWVFIRRRGKSFRKAFHDLQYGGKASALFAAQRHRDNLLLTHRPMSKREWCMKVRASNNSGIPGVYRWVRSDGHVACWRASTQLAGGRVLTRSFSVNCYGEEEAKQLAIEARMRQLEQVDGMHCFSRDLPAMMARLGRARVKTGDVGAREAEAPDRLGVTRVRAGDGGPGWKVCVSRNGQTFEKRFPDQGLGGRRRR